jgi:hypothetical protein
LTYTPLFPFDIVKLVPFSCFLTKIVPIVTSVEPSYMFDSLLFN